MPEVKKRPLTQQEKDRAIYLFGQSTDVKEIGRELGVDPRKISGFIQSQINLGKLHHPNSPGSRESSSPETSPMQTPPPAPSFVPAHEQPSFAAPPAPPVAPLYAPPTYNPAAPAPAYVPPQPPAGPSDGWGVGRPVMGHADGFTNQAVQLRTVVEREIPADGIMGEHSGQFTREQLCETYGEGVYKVLRYEPGRSVPFEHRIKVSAAYGPPKTPRRSTSVESGFGGGRPSFQRPWNSWRSQEQGEPEDGRSSARPMPFSRPDSSIEFARHASSVSAEAASATTEAIKQMGNMQTQMIDHLSKSRESGPDTFLTTFFQTQQSILETKLSEESKRREIERTEEQRRRDQEKKEEEVRWQRRQDELDKAHTRELERIKADSTARAAAAAEERKNQMDLEDRKLQVIREEHKNREESLRDELKRNREELKETLGRSEKEIIATREAMASQMEEAETRSQKRYEEHQAALEREHSLKEKSLEIKEQFQNQVSELKREAIQQAGGDQLFQTINTVIKEFSKGLEKIVDLKKIEALTPEAQAAAVAKGTIDGNVMGEPRSRTAQEPPPAAGQGATSAGSQAQRQTAQNATASQAAAAGAGETISKEQEMELIIQNSMDKPLAQQIIKEWALHVNRGNHPGTFANTFMEWMRDPNDAEGRKATGLFVHFMSAREWKEVLAIIGPKLDAATLAIFRSKAAEDYYEGFKAMVCEQVRDYWEQFLANRKSQRAAATAAGEAAPAAAPQEEIPAASQGGPK